MDFFSKFHHKPTQQYAPPPGAPPPSQQYAPPPGPPPSSSNTLPQWSAASEPSHQWGLLAEASEDEFEQAENFCARYALDTPRLLSSEMIDQISIKGVSCWTLDPPSLQRFSGSIQPRFGPTVRVITTATCQDTCIMSNLPIIGGLYSVPHDQVGVYYEIKINYMNGLIAIGQSCHRSACRPYPEWRLPGWNRLSADPTGGRDYSSSIQSISPGDVVGFGYEFRTGSIFFTYNGERLPIAFSGVYFPHQNQDVFAAIGVEGRNDFEVNFGTVPFIWQGANEGGWRIDAHFGQLESTETPTDALPSYRETVRR
ncbi:hypothetical protein SISNIDRAFT_479078 [Sistotremastrum niveocremeum HHB9708]|uniref:B30.2/SPRY domain-containing protein n=1 Tax=Sistotremastrum niveocremeum HHB9708 TaxID=1314777 RepID=A0A164T9S0_9AGAM|nr:hypothetical protein SISNIDRAFT_479078 [Sistotremastrum niveocremeum HHB9708]